MLNMIDVKQILIVIIAYNPEDNFTDQLSIPNVDYLIVDNSSKPTKNIADFCARSTHCKYQPLNDNVGIAKALNVGCEYAVEHGYKWVVTMDQDSKFTADIFNKMLSFANSFKFLEQTSIFSPLHVLQNNTKLSTPNTPYTERLCVMASGNLLNLDVWKKIGGFTDEMFIDYVDTEYGIKSVLAGYKIIVVNTIEMPHRLGDLKTINFMGKPLKLFGKPMIVLNHNYIRKYYQARNSLYLFKKYLHSDVKLRQVLIFTVYIFITTVLFEKDKLRKMKYMYYGVRDFFKQKYGRLEV